MQNLYNSLISGTTEYRDNGEINQIPPTATMLRAARMIQALVGENNNNRSALINAQVRETALIEEIEQFRVEQKRLYAELLKKDENDTSICNGEQQASALGSECGDSSGSNSDGEGNVTKDDSTSID